MKTPSLPSGSSWLNKVPAVALSFWVIKIMATTVGETGADYLTVNAGLGKTVTACMMAAFLVAALIAQFRVRRCVPWIYWLTVILVSVVGTQITCFSNRPGSPEESCGQQSGMFDDVS